MTANKYASFGFKGNLLYSAGIGKIPAEVFFMQNHADHPEKAARAENNGAQA